MIAPAKSADLERGKHAVTVDAVRPGHEARADGVVWPRGTIIFLLAGRVRPRDPEYEVCSPSRPPWVAPRQALPPERHHPTPPAAVST